MRPSRQRLRAAVLVGAVVLAGCSSESSLPGDTGVVGTAPPGTTGSTDAGSVPAPSATDSPSARPTSEPPDGGLVTGGTSTTTTSSSVAPPAALPTPVPDEADELVLSDAFAAEADTWAEEGSWEVDLPGEASATVIGGVGVMETDRRGTHEWVRALAEDSIHADATLFARITPRRSDEGTVFIGLRGDGEWRDSFQYVPQTGVVLEYGYSPIFEGEIVLIVLDGPDQRRVGPVEGPVLTDGESAEIRFEVEGDRARAKVWRAGHDEPSGWQIEAETTTSEQGMVQISYRDGVARSVAWDELRLVVWPPDASD